MHLWKQFHKQGIIDFTFVKVLKINEVTQKSVLGGPSCTSGISLYGSRDSENVIWTRFSGFLSFWNSIFVIRTRGNVNFWPMHFKHQFLTRTENIILKKAHLKAGFINSWVWNQSPQYHNNRPQNPCVLVQAFDPNVYNAMSKISVVYVQNIHVELIGTCY